MCGTYLDDGTLGGTADEVFEDFNTILRHSPQLGLELNTAKCELLTSKSESTASEDVLSKFKAVAPSIQPMTNKQQLYWGLHSPLRHCHICLPQK